jgi:hypothetical protein
MRLFYFLLISLTANCIAFAEGDAPGAICDAESQLCVPAEARDGACEHPSLVFNKQVQTFLYDGDRFSSDYERRCILQTKSLATRHGDALRLTFRNGTARTYKDKGKKACEQNTSPSCIVYVLYDYFPEHGLFLISVGYYEGGEWLLVRQLNGKEEKIVAPPWYSPDKKWLASVNWSEGLPAPPTGLISYPRSILRSAHFIIGPRPTRFLNLSGGMAGITSP